MNYKPLLMNAGIYLGSYSIAFTYISIASSYIYKISSELPY